MGKKSQYKKIRQRANALPVILENTIERHYVDGQELIEQGMNNMDGVEVNPEKKYIQTMPVQIAFNHARRMKKLYKKMGAEGVLNYEKAVFQFALANAGS